MLKKYILPYLLLIFYKLIVWSWQKRIYETPEWLKDMKSRNPVILAHWHGDEIALMHLIPRYHISTMTSTSKDGQLVDFIIRRLGGKTSKGSSTREGVQALKGLVRLCKKGYPSSMAVDGPKGPIYKAKSGVFELSRLTGAKIYPIGVYSQKSHIFNKSWNQTFLPMPFSQIKIFLGSPLPAIKRGQDPRSDDLKKQLENSLFEVRQKALRSSIDKFVKC